MVREITFRQALRELLFLEMKKSEQMVIFGENFHYTGSLFSKLITPEFHKTFGTHRVIDTPVSENGIVGMALGAALSGTPVVAEVYSADFLYTAGNEIFNDIPKWRYQHRFPGPLRLIIRAPMGVHERGGGGPEHSQCPEAVLHNSPGWVILVPSTVKDGVGLFRSAFRGGDPVLFLEHRQIYNVSESIDMENDFTVPIGKACIALEGGDVTVVAWALMRRRAMAAAQLLIKEGISIEIIDPRTIKPMDFDLILKSVDKTRKLLVVEEAPRTGSIGGEVIATVAEEKHQVKFARLTLPNIPIPCNPELEALAIPSVLDIAEKVKSML